VIDLIQVSWDFFFHIDTYLNEWAAILGPWLYVVMVLIIFCETGLVVTPVLPGDSLLFALGALSTREGSPIELPLMALLLCTAATAGDAVNYSIGRFLGPKVFSQEQSRLFKKKYLLQAQRFYEKHGGMTIFLARFIPIIRTFAPFVAGIGAMRYLRFATFNVTGGITWVLAFLLGGYFFADLPIVKTQFHWVMVVIILISVAPILIEYVRSRRESTSGAP
jgi:membrane-associated protein